MAEDSVAFDVVLEQCRDRHRRLILAVLSGEQRPLTIQDLAKAIVTSYHDVELSAVSAETMTEIHTSLHHIHVPKLENGGFVQYDPERQLVEPTAKFEQLQPSLSAIIEADPDLDPPIEL